MDKVYEHLEHKNEKELRALRAAVDELKSKKRIMETQYKDFARAREKQRQSAKGPIEYYTKQITMQEEKLCAEEAVYESKTDALEAQRRAVNREFDDKMAILESKRKTALEDIDERLAILGSKRNAEKLKRESTIAQYKGEIGNRLAGSAEEPIYPPGYYKMDAEISEKEAKIRVVELMVASCSHNADEAFEARIAQMRAQARQQEKELREAAEAAELEKATRINMERKTNYLAEKKRNEERYEEKQKQGIVEKQQPRLPSIVEKQQSSAEDNYGWELFAGNSEEEEADSEAEEYEEFNKMSRKELHQRFGKERSCAMKTKQRTGRVYEFELKTLKIIQELLETKFGVEVELEIP